MHWQELDTRHKADNFYQLASGLLWGWVTYLEKNLSLLSLEDHVSINVADDAWHEQEFCSTASSWLTKFLNHGGRLKILACSLLFVCGEMSTPVDLKWQENQQDCGFQLLHIRLCYEIFDLEAPLLSVHGMGCSCIFFNYSNKISTYRTGYLHPHRRRTRNWVRNIDVKYLETILSQSRNSDTNK